MWNVNSEDVEWTLTGHDAPVVAVSIWGKRVASLAADIRVWDMVCTGAVPETSQ